jgi:hypothetical protein
MNKIKWIIFFSLMLVTIVLTACQQEIPEDKTNFDYIPTSPGSSWRYTSSRKGRFDLDALTTDTTINGYKYRKFNKLNYSNGLITKAYYGKTNKTYRTYGTTGISLQPGEIILLKDTVVTGLWSSQVPQGSTGFIDIHKFTIAARDLQYTVNSVVYNNFIRLDYEWLVFDPNAGQQIHFGDGKFFYARGIGLIESVCDGQWGLPPNREQDTVRLYNYNIK